MAELTADMEAVFSSFLSTQSRIQRLIQSSTLLLSLRKEFDETDEINYPEGQLDNLSEAQQVAQSSEQAANEVGHLKERVKHLKELFADIPELQQVAEAIEQEVNEVGHLKERVKHLKEHSNRMEETLQVAEDIGRAVIVLLHATLEDTLRELVRIKLRYSPEQIPDKLTLQLPGEKADKFRVQDLKKYVGNSVEEILQNSLDEYLNRTSIGGIDNLIKFVEMIGTNTVFLEPYKPHLVGLIKRRHEIVHKADRSGRSLNKVDNGEIATWLESVTNVVAITACYAFGLEDVVSTEEIKELLSSLNHISLPIERLAPD